MSTHAEYPSSREEDVSGTVWSYFSRTTLAPRKTAPAKFQEGFNESLYHLRNRAVVVIILCLALPAAFVLTPPPKPPLGFAIGAYVQIALYLVLAAVFAVPQVRYAAFKSKYSQWVATAIVMLPYIVVSPFVAMQPSLFPLAAIKRIMFLVLYITAATILHAHPVAILVAHSVLMAMYIVALERLEHDPATIAISGSVVAITALLLYAAFYYVGFARCQAYLMRVQAVQTRSGAAASGINSTFIRQVLHDFGTPVSTLTLGIGEFSTTRLTTRQKVTLEEIRLACWHVNSLRDRAMKFAVDPLHLALPRNELVEIDIKDFVYSILRPLIQVYVKLFQNVRLVIDLKPDLPRAVQTEPDWLLDILLNLLDNAYRFTREGTVTLQVSHDAAKARVIFKVMDTGPGIPEEERQYVLHPFVQGRAGRLARHGNGLGLWSVYVKSRALGGACDVRNNVPHGTTVAISLPTRYTTNALSLAYDADFLAPVEAPHVIEPAVQGNLLGDVSSSSTANTTAAQPSETPVQFPTPAPSEPQPECQPGADVEEARGGTAAAAQPRAGTDGTAQELEAVNPPGATVLVVEDQMPVRRLFKRALERRNVTVEEATNGVEGLAKLKEREYDCVFSDMWMPEMNGDEMTAAFRVWEAANRQRRQLIIAVSAVDTAEAEQQAFASGVDGFLRKPVDVEAALRCVCQQHGRCSDGFVCGTAS